MKHRGIFHLSSTRPGKKLQRVHMVAKQFLLKITLAATFTIASSIGSHGQSSCAPVTLECEYLVAPIGIDAALPRLSWRLDDSRVGAKQTAYRIFVGTDSIAVSRGTGN